MLQLLGADVLAVGQNNEVLFAARDVIVAILVDAAQIAGMEPAVLVDDFSGGLGVFIIAQHDAVAPDADLAGLIQLILAVVVRLAHGAHVVRRLGKVEDAVAECLGHAIALVDHKAVGGQLFQHLGVEGGGGAAQVPQTVETLHAASFVIVVNGLHQHGGRSHDVAVHQAKVAVEIADIAAEVQGPACRRVGHDTDKAGHVEERQQGHMAQRQLLARGQGVGDPVFSHLGVSDQRGAHVPLREHDALAAAGGAGGEHQHHEAVVVHTVGQLPGSGILVAVHGAEQRAVSGLQLGTAAVINAVVQNQGRLHLVQLIFQLVPGLLLVQRDQHAAGQNDAVGRHAELIAVAAQQHHTAALEVRHFVFQVGDHLADVPRILAVVLFHHGLAVFGHITDGHIVRELLLHAAGDHIIHTSGNFDLLCHSYSSPLCQNV